MSAIYNVLHSTIDINVSCIYYTTLYLS